ncbi:MAG TPA: glycosyltransferase family 1 protein, partial [Chlamydiales bacterium]|nr:glycosyltransferase family 1 protein [Chlamydiales bacterium]
LAKAIPSCDLFWSPHYNIPLLPIRAKKRVATIHDACHLALRHLLSLPERIYAKWVMKAALNRSHAVLTDSVFSKNELTSFLGGKEIEVITLGVDLDRYQRVIDLKAIDSVKRKYKLPDRFILFVGNLKPHKNLLGLVQAFKKTRLTDWGLVIAGKAKGLRNQEEAIAGERILTIGEVPDADLPVLYSMAGMLVLPSFYEGFGFPPLEAMSCGCPTIVSNAASLPEVCGEASLYVDPRNLDDMASKIRQLACDEGAQNSLIQRGFLHVQRFCWDKTASDYQKLFEGVHTK